MGEPSRLWGVLGEFPDAESLVRAAGKLSGEVGVSLEAFTPFPIDDLHEAMRFKASPMPAILLAGAVVGASSMYAFQCWINLVAYPLNIGGRPLHSWPSFVPPTFEFMVLIASLAGMFGLFFVCGLPRLHHPVFEVEAFKRASDDGFFLALRSESDRVDGDRLRGLLVDAGATQSWEVDCG